MTAARAGGSRRDAMSQVWRRTGRHDGEGSDGELSVPAWIAPGEP
jgi:hypothetical protein